MKKNTAAERPPMGWNSWDCYGAGVTEEALLANARFVRDNMKVAGYEYIVCDIQWSEPGARSTSYNNFAELCMDEYSRLIPAPNRFPSSEGGRGFAPIAEEIHSMGLKFGIHIMRGVPRQAVHRNTPIKADGLTARSIAAQFSVCPWNTDMYGVADVPGAQEYYDSLFALYASWGVDFVKVDDIANTEFRPDMPYSAKREIEMIRRAIDRCGRQMVLSLSPGPAPVEQAAHLSRNADMWRMSGDFWDEWDKLRNMFDLCEKWYPWTRGGRWPDCDMLPAGMLRVNVPEEKHRSRFTPAELRTMMTLWCVFRSPLICGGDLPTTDTETLKLLTDPFLISLDQKGRDEEPVASGGGLRVWRTVTEDGLDVYAVFNISEKPFTFGTDTVSPSSQVREYLFDGTFAPTGRGAVLNIAPHDVKLLTVCKQ